MATQTSMQMRLKIYLRRECYVWLCRRGQRCINFGWILSYRGNDNVVFKSDDRRSAEQIPVGDIESCGAI